MYKPGDYICVDINSHSPGAWLADHAIQFFTHSKFCHAFLYVDTDGTIVESTPRQGVQKANISKYAGMLKVGSTTELTNDQREGIIEAAYSYVGKTGYGFLDIVNLAFYTRGINLTWLENEVQEEDHRTICSQLVAMCGRAKRVFEWMCGKKYPTLVTPADLARLAMK